MVTIRVHYDGKVFVPDGAVALAPGDQAEVSFKSPSRQDRTSNRGILSAVITDLDPETARAIAEDPSLASENL